MMTKPMFSRVSVRNYKRSHKASTGSIDVNWDIKVALNEEIVDGLDILVLTSISRSKNSTHTNGVLVTQVNGLFWIHDKTIRRTVDELLVNLKVASGLFPTDLNGRGHDDIGMFCALTLGDSAVLPAPLHGQNTEHDGF
ncbi:hypothetical protein HG531_012633 [Fusarium graminearum]|nr:hypothetical protein HG531_012633 [Fusarium graminearum]